MKLELGAWGRVSPEHRERLDQIIIEQRNNFNDFIGDLCLRHDELAWWFSAPASRNTITSPLFYSCCTLLLLRELLEKGQDISEVMTDSPALGHTVCTYLHDIGKPISVVVRPISYLRRIKSRVGPYYRYVTILIENLLQWYVARIVLSKTKRSLPTADLTLVDTYVARKYMENDRYYPGMWECLSDDERDSLFFVPTIVLARITKTRNIYESMAKSAKNFLFKESFLKFHDYVYAFSFFWKIKAMRITRCVFAGLDVTNLVQHEISNVNDYNQTVIAVLNFRFAQRLKETGIKLRLIIDWFENQIVDKGWNAGFNEYYPEVPIVGYQGFIVPCHYLSRYPTTVECDAGFIPNEVTVTGRGLMSRAKEFCPTLQVGIAPAFRFSELWNEQKNEPKLHKSAVLIGLPISIHDSLELVNTIAKLTEDRSNLDVHVLIKQHPTVTTQLIRDLCDGSWPDNFVFVDPSWSVVECIDRADIVISNGSSICVEALARGVPVIVVGSQAGITHNPIPHDIDKSIWRLCYNTREIAEAIRHFLLRGEQERERYQVVGARIREQYFAPVTPDSVRKFLQLPRVSSGLRRAAP